MLKFEKFQEYFKNEPEAEIFFPCFLMVDSLCKYFLFVNKIYVLTKPYKFLH